MTYHLCLPNPLIRISKGKTCSSAMFLWASNCNDLAQTDIRGFLEQKKRDTFLSLKSYKSYKTVLF